MYSIYYLRDMSSETKTTNKFNIKDYQELIDTLAKVEYKKLSSKHLIDFSPFF